MTQPYAGDVLVELRPFVHQVGGHTCILEVNNSPIICKPFEDREVRFYNAKPDKLAEFTPRYLGEIDVICEINVNQKCLKASVPFSVATQTGIRLTETGCKRKRPLPGNFGPRLHVKQMSHKDQKKHADTKSLEIKAGLELWSTRCIDRQITRKGFWANNEPQKFIMLENLVHSYVWPCMLDMKMGTRQYGEDSSVEKRKLLADRCARSTSATLGFRICGTQVFKADSQSYMTHDKYAGRDLDEQGVRAELFHFFHNGVFFRRDAVVLMIEKLKRLRQLLEEQDTLFFFSCSLLLMYDGAFSKQDLTENEASAVLPEVNLTSGHQKVDSKDVSSCSDTKVDVRLIDFAHVSSKQEVAEGDLFADEGILFGLNNVVTILESFL